MVAFTVLCVLAAMCLAFLAALLWCGGDEEARAVLFVIVAIILVLICVEIVKRADQIDRPAASKGKE